LISLPVNLPPTNSKNKKGAKPPTSSEFSPLFQ
jgi:hypothetical protein